MLYSQVMPYGLDNTPGQKLTSVQSSDDFLFFIFCFYFTGLKTGLASRQRYIYPGC